MNILLPCCIFYWHCTARLSELHRVAAHTCSSTAAMSCWHPELCIRMPDCSFVDELKHATCLAVESKGHSNVCIYHVWTCSTLRTANQHVVPRLLVHSALQIRLPSLS